MKIKHQIQIRPGTEIKFRDDQVGPVLTGVVARVVTLYIVDTWGEAIEGVTLMTVKAGSRILENIGFEELINSEDYWRNETIVVEALSGRAKPGLVHNDATVQRVIFKVIADETILNGQVFTAGFCYTVTPDRVIRRKEFDQVGL